MGKQATRTEEFTEERRLALMALAHHYLARNKDGANGTHLGRNMWFAKLYDGAWKALVPRAEAKKDFDNFLGKASIKSSRFVYAYLRKVMAKKSYHSEASQHVQKAIELAFGYDGQKLKEGSTLSETVGKITQDGEVYADRLAHKYAGLWDVIRFSAHGDEKHPKSRDPRVMRAAMQINLPEQDGGSPDFEIRYRPGSLIETDDFFVCRGSVLVLGRGDHLMFMGWEDASLYPIQIYSIVEEHSPRQSVDLFFGLVIRRHENKHIFASRVLFLRSPESSLDKASTGIGMFRQSEVLQAIEARSGHKDFHKAMKVIVNRICSEGHSGLWLKKA